MKKDRVKIEILKSDEGILKFFMSSLKTTDTTSGFNQMIIKMNSLNQDCILLSSKVIDLEKELSTLRKSSSSLDYIR